METHEVDAVVAISLMAAFADGEKQDPEREHLKDIFESLGVGNAPAIYQKVMLKQVRLGDVAGALDSTAKRHFAYEMAVGVCDADNLINDQEKRFLGDLREALGLDRQEAESMEQSAEAVVTAAAPADGANSPTTPDDADVDKAIIRYAVFAAALELLPQNLATLAIVPVQLKLVHKVSALHGYELGMAHIKEFVGAIGVGLTSQYVEGFARKLLGGMVSGFAGGWGGFAAGAATGGAMTFASTYAMGKVAKAYYSGGRSLDTDALKRMFSELAGEGQNVFSKYQGAIGEQAKKIDMSKLTSLIQNG